VARYNASRGGHAPGHLREEFLDIIEQMDWERAFLGKGKLLGALWNCTDQIGSGYVALLMDGFQLDQDEARNFNGRCASVVRRLEHWLQARGVKL
jgi:hypothetical protein